MFIRKYQFDSPSSGRTGYVQPYPVRSDIPERSYILCQQIDQGMVQELVGDLAKRCGSDKRISSIPLKTGVQIVQDAVTGEGNILFPHITFVKLFVKRRRVIMYRLGMFVANSREHGGIELYFTAGFDFLKADVNQGPVIIGHQGQSDIKLVAGDIVGKVLFDSVVHNFRAGEAVGAEGESVSFTMFENVDDAHIH